MRKLTNTFKNKHRRLSFLVVIFSVAVFFGGCEMPQNPPKFLNVNNIKTSKLSGTVLNFNANAVFNNPNDMGMRLKSVEIDVLLKGKKVGHISQKSKIRIPAKGNFSVPLSVELDLKQLGSITGIFGILSGKKMKADFTGYIRISKNAIVMKVPVKHTEAIKL